MVPQNKPLRVVRTIAGQSTGGTDDILVDENGGHWKRVTGMEASQTQVSVVRAVRDGMIW